MLTTEIWSCLREDNKFCFRKSKGGDLLDIQIRGLVVVRWMVGVMKEGQPQDGEVTTKKYSQAWLRFPTKVFFLSIGSRNISWFLHPRDCWRSRIPFNYQLFRASHGQGHMSTHFSYTLTIGNE